MDFEVGGVPGGWFPRKGCPERLNTLGILRDNFMYQHWKSKVAIMQ